MDIGDAIGVEVEVAPWGRWLHQWDWSSWNTTVSGSAWHDSSFQIKIPGCFSFNIGGIAIILWLPNTSLDIAVELVIASFPNIL